MGGPGYDAMKPILCSELGTERNLALFCIRCDLSEVQERPREIMAVP